MEFNRKQRRRTGTVDAWWPYCELHSYGRVVRDGEIWWEPSAE